MTETTDRLISEGHTQECADFWNAVLLMDRLGERWDHWTQPTCPACTARRKSKGIEECHED